MTLSMECLHLLFSPQLEAWAGNRTAAALFSGQKLAEMQVAILRTAMSSRVHPIMYTNVSLEGKILTSLCCNQFSLFLFSGCCTTLSNGQQPLHYCFLKKAH